MPTVKKKQRKTKKVEPLWKGPVVDGITFSLLSVFLVCRERFRLLVVEGLKEPDTFNHRLEFGHMFHRCEESYGLGEKWEIALGNYALDLVKKYRESQKQVEHWYNVCLKLFPLYLSYWSYNIVEKDTTPLLSEQVFSVPYTLPSGRVVTLRGKWDRLDLIGKKTKRLYLRENKTKGEVNERLIVRQLSFDLQTMLYLTALCGELETNNTGILGENYTYGVPAGVLYNVVLRPLSGGKHSIRQHKPTKSNPKGESDEEFYDRLAGLIKSEPEYFFLRKKVEVIPSDVEKFKKRFLDPTLEQLCDWWDWICEQPGLDPWQPYEGAKHPSGYREFNKLHWQTPYGFYNPLAEGASTELDEYLATGSRVGLEKATNLFSELEE